MTCPRCDGLYVQDWDTEIGAFQKCINCGGTMPRFSGTPEEIKRKTDEWAEKCRQSRAQKEHAKTKPTVDLLQPDARPKVGRQKKVVEQLPVIWSNPTNQPLHPTVTDWLSGSIQAVDQEISRLQVVKGQLEEIHNQQVVNR